MRWPPAHARRSRGGGAIAPTAAQARALGGRSRRRAALALLAAQALALVAADVARATHACRSVTDNRHLVADATRTGVIDLHFYEAGGARVEFFECVGERLLELGARSHPAGAAQPPTTSTQLRDATAWKCSRRTRRFLAVAARRDLAARRVAVAVGAYSVRTPSCARRLALHVPRRVAPGARARIRVEDRWGLGAIRPRLCVAAPRRPRSCRAVRLARAVPVATVRLRPRTPGRWRAELDLRGHRERAAFQVGRGSAARAPRRPVLLATGDSTMQGIDSFLDDELGARMAVRSDVRPGSQLSRTTFWPRHARRQVRRLRPAATVISIGAASDGFPMTTPAGARAVCCEPPWVAEYARRVRALMRTYRRGGRARVLWLTLPAPRYPERARIAAAVNAAIVRAADGLAGARAIRIDLMLSPFGFQERIRHGGRLVRVREPDGIHLNVAGTALAARAIARALREP